MFGCFNVAKEFIEKAYNSKDIAQAVRQEEQLSYFTTSKLQENSPSDEYITQWAERKFQTNDHFLNWVKSIFKTENFLLFYKYLRYPLPSTRIVKNKIEPQLNRVFNAEDADFRYNVSGVEISDFIDELKINWYQKELFHRLLYRHNSIQIADLDSDKPNKPIRYFVDIDNVVSLEEKKGKINKIAFRGCIEIEEKKVKGIIYIDSEKYSFLNDSNEVLKESPHDLGYCPAEFISPYKYNNNFVIRESIFTYIREEIEEYNFLKTLQRMTEPNGAIPVVTKIESTPEQNNGVNGSEGEPEVDTFMGSQRAKIFNQNKSLGTGDLLPGTIHEIPLSNLQNADGSINTDAVVNYLNFHYIPIEALEYLSKRIKEIENSIISTVVGDVVESNEESKNKLQISKSISVLENTLNSFAYVLNTTRKKSDFNMLALKYGKERVNEVFIHYGTDFFLDTESKLFEDLKNAPNSLERKNIIVRINLNKHKNNIDQLKRNKLLYDLIPYVSDKDFEYAVAQSLVSEENKQYQTRFNFWISRFEAEYGDIVAFYKNLNVDNSEKILFINNLIIELIKSSQLEDIEKQQKDDIPLAQRIGIGGTQSLQAILVDPNLGIGQKANALMILFGISKDEAYLLSKKEENENSNLVKDSQGLRSE